MNRQDFLKFIKLIKEKWREMILIALVSALSFALGYIYAEENNRAPIVIEKYSDKK